MEGAGQAESQAESMSEGIRCEHCLDASCVLGSLCSQDLLLLPSGPHSGTFDSAVSVFKASYLAPPRTLCPALFGLHVCFI